MDLIYLDPPFNKKKMWAAPIGSEAAGAVFKDTWTLNDIDIAELGIMAEKNPALAELIDAVGKIDGTADKSYLLMMAPRLVEMHRILKDTGSIFLHCDSTMSHSLKLMLDAIFGKGNFRNEIVWHYRTYKGKASQYYPRKHDCIFWYSKDENKHRGMGYFELEYDSNYKATVDYKRWRKYYVNGNEIKFRHYPDRDSRFTSYLNRWIKENGRQPANDDTIYSCRGYVVDDVWEDIQAIDPKDKNEKIYMTQKPLKLLKRIINASSKEGDVVLDPFCGCATSCVASEDLNRQWVGIDISEKAYDLIKIRFRKELKLFNPSIIHRKDIPIRSDGIKVSKNIKQTRYGEQHGNCKGCKHHFPYQGLTKDHIIPVSKGGPDDDSNIQLLCLSCNSVKGDRDMAFLISQLRKNGTINPNTR